MYTYSRSRDYLIQMNDSVTELPLHLEVSTITNYYFQILTQMEQSFKMQVGNSPPLLF